MQALTQLVDHEAQALNHGSSPAVQLQLIVSASMLTADSLRCTQLRVKPLRAFLLPGPETTLFLDLQTMLDNISIYWFSGTAASSLRIYKESMSTGDRQTLAKGYCQVTRQHLHAVQHSLLATGLLSVRQVTGQHLFLHGHPTGTLSAAGIGSQLLVLMY